MRWVLIKRYATDDVLSMMIYLFEIEKIKIKIRKRKRKKKKNRRRGKEGQMCTVKFENKWSKEVVLKLCNLIEK